MSEQAATAPVIGGPGSATEASARLHVERRITDGGPPGRGLAWDPTGRRVATTSETPGFGTGALLHLWDIPADPWAVPDTTGAGPAASLEISWLSPWALDWSRDGSVIAVAQSSDVAIVDLSASEPSARIISVGHPRVLDVSLHPSGRLVAVAGDDGRLEIWSTALGTIEALTSIDIGTAQSTTVAFSPDGELLACGDGDGNLWITAMDVATPARPHRIGLDGAVHALAWTLSGERLAVGVVNRVYDFPLDRLRLDDGPSSDFTIHDMSTVVWSLAWDDEGRRLAVGQSNGELTVISGSNEVRTVQTSQDMVTGAGFRPGTRQLAATGVDGHLRIFDAGAIDRPPRTCSLGGTAFRDAAWNRTRTRLAAAGGDGYFRFYGPELGLPNAVVGQPDLAPQVAVAWSPDGLRVAVVDGQNRVAVRQADDPRLPRTGEALWDPADQILTAAWSPNGRQLAFGTEHGSVLLVDDDLAAPPTERLLDGPPIIQVEWSPSGQALAAVSHTGETWVLDSVGLRASPLDAGPAAALSWSSDALLLVVLEGGDLVSVERATGRVSDRRTLAGAAGLVLRAAWSPDRSRVALIRDDGWIEVHDLEGARTRLVGSFLLDGAAFVVWGGNDRARFVVVDESGFLNQFVVAPPSRDEVATRSEAEVESERLADTDLLYRRPLQLHLARQLRRLAHPRPPAPTTVAMHLDGSWGAGKTTLAKFMARDLAHADPAEPGSNRSATGFPDVEWNVVYLNAWRAAQGAPWWWSLTAGIREGLAGQRTSGQRLGFRALDLVVRLVRTGTLLSYSAVAAVAAALTGLAIAFWGWPPSVPDLAKIAAGLAVVGTFATAVNRFVLWDSPTGARLHERADRSPMDDVCAHLGWLRRWAPRRPERRHRTLAAVAIGAFLVLGACAVAFVLSMPVRDETAALDDPRAVWWITLAVGAAVGVAVFALTAPAHRSAICPEFANAEDPDLAERPAALPPRAGGALVGATLLAAAATAVGWVGLEVLGWGWWRWAIAVAAAIGAAVGGWSDQRHSPQSGAGIARLGTAIGAGWLAAAPFAVWHLLAGRDLVPERWGWGPAFWAALLGLLALAGPAAVAVADRRGNQRKAPILVVVDEVDRCTAEEVVQLLEAIQTVARSEVPVPHAPWRQPVSLAFLVLGDGRWIRTAFEHGYDDFNPAEPDLLDPLGARFIQKLFEITARVPDLAPDQFISFVSSVLELPGAAAPRRPRPQDGIDLAPSATGAPETASGGLRAPRAPGPQVGDGQAEQPVRDVFVSPDDQADAAKAAALRESTADVDADLQHAEHQLKAYAPYLEPNPRGIRRTATAFQVNMAVHRTLWVLDPDSDPDHRDLLTRWTILVTRWPALAERLVDPTATSEADVLDQEVRKAMAHPEVRAVLGDPDAQQRLIDAFSHLRVPAHRRPAAVTIDELRTAAGNRPFR